MRQVEISTPVNDVLVTKIAATGGAKPLGSQDVISGKRRGRHTITVTAIDAPAYIGGKNVTAALGVPVAAGETATLKITSSAADRLYVLGTVMLGEYF